MSAEIYTHKPHRVAALLWTGTNRDEAGRFLRDWLGDDVQVAELDPDEKFDYPEDALVLQFYADNDDQEVDPGRWILIDIENPEASDRKVDSFDPDEFAMHFEPAGVSS